MVTIGTIFRRPAPAEVFRSIFLQGLTGFFDRPDLSVVAAGSVFH
jgi:hypothetical protein